MNDSSWAGAGRCGFPVWPSRKDTLEREIAWRNKRELNPRMTDFFLGIILFDGASNLGL